MTRLLLIWIAGSLLLAALLAPPLHSAAQALYGEPLPWPYRRLFNRVALLSALLLLVILRRRLHLSELGRSWRSERGRRLAPLARGVCLALLGGCLAIPLVHASSDVQRADLSVAFLAPRILEGLWVGLVVSLIEEGFFRVIVLRGLAREWPWPLAVLGSAGVYAFVHFLTPDRSYVYPGLSAFVGLEYLGAVLGRMLAPGAWAGFTGLFLVGCVLGLCMLRTGSFMLCVGLHAGWVLAAKLGVWFTAPPEGVSWPPGWQRLFLLEQPITWGVILLTALLVCRGPAIVGPGREVTGATGRDS